MRRCWLPFMTLCLIGAMVAAQGEMRVTIEVKEATVAEAFDQLFRAVGENFVLMPGTPTEQRLTLRLVDVPFERALSFLCEVAGLKWERKDGTYLISPAPRPPVPPTIPAMPRTPQPKKNATHAVTNNETAAGNRLRCVRSRCHSRFGTGGMPSLWAIARSTATSRCHRCASARQSSQTSMCCTKLSHWLSSNSPSTHANSCRRTCRQVIAFASHALMAMHPSSPAGWLIALAPKRPAFGRCFP